MDEQNTPVSVSPEAAPKTEKRRKRKNLAAWLLLAVALALLVAVVMLFTIRIGSGLALYTDVADVRARAISCEDYDEAIARRPDAVIRWSVPIGDERFDSFSEELVLSALPEDEIERLAYFPALRHVDAESCADYPALAAAAAKFPAVAFSWHVPTADGPVDGNSTSLAVRTLSAAETEELLPLLPRLEEVDLRESALSDDEIDAFAAAHDELTVRFTVPLWGMEIPGESETLRLPEGAGGDAEELYAALGRLTKLKKLDLRDCDLTPSKLARILELCGGVEMDYVIRLGGCTFTADAEEIDISGSYIDDLDEVRATVSLMPKLKKVVMSDCGVSDAEMDALDQEYEDVRFVWTVHFNIYSLRTDATFFCAADVPFLNYDAPVLNDAQLYPVRYCRDMIALDLGHMWIEDLSFLYNMPHLKYLILVGGRFRDITPIGSLEDLQYLEIFQTNPKDISPLVNCKKLEHLNMCYCFGFDLSPLKEMKQLKRLWWAGLGPIRGAELIEALPDTYVYCPFEDPQGSTGGGWREDEAYYEMRDQFAMYYQPGGTGIH